MPITFHPEIGCQETEATVLIRDEDLIGNTDSASSISLAGSVISAAGRIQRLEFGSSGSSLGQAEVSISVGSMRLWAPRLLSDVANRQAEAALVGFETRLSRLNIDHRVPISLLAHIEIEDVVQLVRLGRITGIGAPQVHWSNSGRWSPIMVNALGRSGTTVLMAYLAAHPAIIAANVSQFEFRQASYLWHAAEVLTSPGNFCTSMHPDSFEGRSRHAIGYNPYWTSQFLNPTPLRAVEFWLEHKYVTDGVSFMVEQFDSYCDALASDLKKPGGRFLAEKVIGSPMTTFVRNVFPEAREVFLVRDFRDVFVSARRFNEQRGTISFGREGTDDDTAWMKILAHDANRLWAIFQSRADRVFTLHYEELITNTRQSLSRLYEHFGLDASEELIDSVLLDVTRNHTNAAQHTTSVNIAGSVGRWRNEMSEREKQLAAEIFAGPLAAFGYVAS